MTSWSPQKRAPTSFQSPEFESPSLGQSSPHRRDLSPEIDPSSAKRASIAGGRIFLSAPRKRRRADNASPYGEDTVMAMLERIDQTVADSGRAARAFETRFDNHVVDVQQQFENMRDMVVLLFDEVAELRRLVKGKGRESVGRLEDNHAPPPIDADPQTPLSQVASHNDSEVGSSSDPTRRAPHIAAVQRGAVFSSSAGETTFPTYGHSIQDLKDRYRRVLFEGSPLLDGQRTVPFSFHKRPGANREHGEYPEAQRGQTEVEELADLSSAWGHQEARNRPSISTRASFPKAATEEEADEESSSSAEEEGPEEPGKLDGGGPGWPAMPPVHYNSSVLCEICQRRAHRTCAGLPTSGPVRRWKCPTCASSSSAKQPTVSLSVCLRPDCDKPILVPPVPRREGAKDEHPEESGMYIPRSLMGRRVYYHLGVRKEFVLIRWKDWESYDSTWESPEGLPPTWLRSETEDLDNEAAEEGRDLTKTHVFIRPRARKWFTPDGKYRTSEIYEVTGKSRSWWWKKWSDKTAPLWWGSEPELEKSYPVPDDSWGE